MTLNDPSVPSSTPAPASPPEFHPADQVEAQTNPEIQWRVVLLAVLIVYFLGQVNLATVVSQISTATSAALSQLSQFSQKPAEAASSSGNQPSADAKLQDGYPRYFLIELSSENDSTIRPEVFCESSRYSSETVRLPRCR